MKIRILGNSIRFRLKQSEVKRFHTEGTIKEITSFGQEASDKLSYILKTTSSDQFNLLFQSNNIIIEIPTTICTEWTETEMVGISEMIDTGKGETISILVEKDFACLDGSDEENQDNYPTPNVECL